MLFHDPLSPDNKISSIDVSSKNDNLIILKTSEILPDKKAFVKSGDMVLNLINGSSSIEFVTKLVDLMKNCNLTPNLQIFNENSHAYKGDNLETEKTRHEIVYVNNRSLRGQIVANKEKKLEVYYDKEL